MIGIDEETLAWFYIAPGHEHDDTTQQLLKLALDLIGPECWTVVQVGDSAGEGFCAACGLRIVESYPNEAPEPRGISVHLAQIAPQPQPR
jgi:hypothetical protein